MNIIHLISGGDSGGARTHVHLLLKHLSRDNSVKLVCFMPGSFADDARALGIDTLVIAKPLGATLRELTRLIREEGCQVVHCHGSRANLIAALIKGNISAPIVSTVHSDPRIDYLGRPLARISYGSLNALALRRIDYHIGVSDAMKELLCSRGFDPRRLYSIYNGVEFGEEKPKSPEERREFLASLGLDWPEDCIIAGIAARFHPIKDIPTLLRGFAEAQKSCPGLRLLIAGDGPGGAELRALAGELNIEKYCCFAGWQADPELFYRSLDINTLTSLSETFPYALTEGARAHLPTVASRVGGVPMLIRHGEHGLLFEAGNPSELARCLTELASSPALREKYGEALHRRVASDFSAAATARRQKSIYEAILADHREYRDEGRRGVLICGAYGMGNSGDEAILDAITAEMRSIDPYMPMTVMTRTPKETAIKHGVRAVHTLNFPGFLRAARKSRLYINGGGSLIQDITSNRSIWYYLMTLRSAKKLGCRVMMYGCGIGPVKREYNRRRAADVINRYVDAICLREENSRRELESMGVRKPEILQTSDPALFIKPAEDREINAILSRHGLGSDEKLICFCLRNWGGYGKKAPWFGEAARYARERWGLRPVFLCLNHKKDGYPSALAAQSCGGNFVIIDEALSSGEIVGLISRMEAVVSMRLHALIFAASQAVPAAGVSYDPKVRAFLDYIGQDICTDYEELSPRVLRDFVDRAVTADRDRIREATERIMAIESGNTETAKRLLSTF